MPFIIIVYAPLRLLLCRRLPCAIDIDYFFDMLYCDIIHCFFSLPLLPSLLLLFYFMYILLPFDALSSMMCSLFRPLLPLPAIPLFHYYFAYSP